MNEGEVEGRKEGSKEVDEERRKVLTKTRFLRYPANDIMVTQYKKKKKNHLPAGKVNRDSRRMYLEEGRLGRG